MGRGIFCRENQFDCVQVQYGIPIDKLGLTEYNKIRRCISAFPKGHFGANENVFSELLLALIKKFNCECFATLEGDCNNRGQIISAPLFNGIIWLEKTVWTI